MLRALLPHMMSNPQLGLIRATQGIYNLPKSLNRSFETFINSVEPSRYLLVFFTLSSWN